ncbi:MAG: D-alanine--D-alanine ligase [Acidobacteria bacterium]|nr:D-alanine--D-alanine ligase [Acidobacteriota bacterium]
MARGPKTRLGVLFGGRSGEHEVSVRSAASVIEALDPAEYEISVIGITKAGRIASPQETRSMLPARLGDRIAPCEILNGDGDHVHLLPVPSAGRRGGGHPDIVFPLLHGPYGEDGTIQGLLEIAGVPYIGCGVLASAVGMDKDVMKRLFVCAGLPVLPYRTFASAEIRNRPGEIRDELEAAFGYPMFSKPANLGSSVGVRKIHGKEEFAEAVAFSAQFDRKIIVEKGIDARELECAILGNDEPRASVVGEVIPTREFYDYDAKYVVPSRLDIPACISGEDAEQIRNIAVRAFQAIDGAGLSRVDFFMERASGRIWLNEINTMPGFTPISMYAKLWDATGVPFAELIRRLVCLGLERSKERMAFRIAL